jgi:hypothetical protein
MRLTLMWTGIADLDLYLANPGCTRPANCQLLATADGFVNAEIITRTVACGEAFRLFVDNNNTTESVIYTLTIRID